MNPLAGYLLVLQLDQDHQQDREDLEHPEKQSIHYNTNKVLLGIFNMPKSRQKQK